MSYQYSRILLPMTAMADFGCDGRLFTVTKLVGTGPKRQVTHAWNAAPLEISVPSWRHQGYGVYTEPRRTSNTSDCNYISSPLLSGLY
jgi:hypothetical protein